MAGRINVRFLIILTIAVTFFVGLALGFYFVTRNAGAWVKKGDKYLAQGDYEAAIKAYGRAVRKDADNLEYTYKYADAIATQPIDNLTDAKLAMASIDAAYRQATREVHDDPEPFLKLMDYYMKLANELDSGYYTVILNRAEEKFNQTPDMKEVRKYRGIGMTKEMEYQEVTDEDRQLAYEDLQFALEQNPEDHEATYFLALWKLLEAEHIDSDAGDPKKAAELRQQARQMTRDAMNENPQSAKLKLNHAELLLRNQSINNLPDEAIQLLADLETQMLEKPGTVIDVMTLARLLDATDKKPVEVEELGISLTNGNFRAEKVLAAALQKYPDDIRLIVMHAKYQKQSGQLDQALQSYQHAREMTFSVDPFMARRFGQYQQQATISYVELLLATIDQKTDAEKQKVYALVESILKQEEQAKEMPSATIMLLRGKMAFVQEDWPKAANLLSKASTEMGDRSFDALRQASMALMRSNQYGEAARRYERLLDIAPTYNPARYELIKIYVRLKQIADANRHVDYLRENQPNNPLGLDFQVGIWTETGNYDKAIRGALQLGWDKTADNARRLARIYVKAELLDDARKLLEKYAAEDPSDVSLLQQMMMTTEDTELRAQWIDRARNAAVNPEMLNLMELQFVKGEKLTAEQLIAAAPEDDDPEARQVRLFRILAAAGQTEDAVKAFEELEKMNPNHPEVITRRFGEALALREWENARKWADRAEQTNLDLAQGLFFKARLEFAQENYARAEELFKQALEIRPVYFEGWRQLADTQRVRKNLVQAAASYQKALEQRPDDVNSLYGMALIEAGQGDTDEALALFRRAVKYAPENQTVQEAYLAFEQKYGNREIALAKRRDRMEEHKEDMANRMAYALLLSEVDQHEQAIKVIEEIIEEVDLNIQTALAKAQILHKSGEEEEARRLLLRYVNSLDPDVIESGHWVAVARYMLDIGDMDAAMSAYRQAAEIEDPETRPVSREMAEQLKRRRQFEDAIDVLKSLMESDPQDKNIALSLVETLIFAERIDEAEQYMDKVITEHGTDATIMLLQANICKAQGDRDQALQLYSRAAEMQPRNATIFLSRGVLLADDPSQDAQAVEDFERALELNPMLTTARLKLAVIYNRRGDTRDAVRELNAVIRFKPDNFEARLRLYSVYLQANDRLSAKKVAREAAEQQLDRKAFWLNSLASLEASDKDYDTAIDLFAEAFAIEKSVNTLAMMTMAQVEGGKSRDALQLLRDNPEMLNDYSKLQAIRVLALLKIDQQAQANSVLANILSRAQSYGQIAAIAQQLSEGLTRKQTIELIDGIHATDQHQLWLTMAAAQLELADNNFENAYSRLKSLEPMIEESSDIEGSYLMLVASAAHRSGLQDQAVEVYERLVKLHPGNLTVLNNFAYLLIEMQQYDRGMQLAKEALELAPNHSPVLDTCGWAYFKTGNLQEARSMLLRSVELERTATNNYHLAEVLYKMGNDVQARDYMIRAEQLAEETDDQAILDIVTRRLDEMQR